MWSSLKRFWSVDDLSSMGVRLVFQGVFEGLRLNGKELRTFPLNPNEPDFRTKLRDDLLQFEPDAVLLANFPASYYLRQFGIDEFPFQCIVWILDEPGMMTEQCFEDHEIVLVADPKFERQVRERGAKRVFFVPVAAPDEIPSNYKSEYDYPLAYVGSIYIPHELRNRIQPDQVRLLTQLIHRKAENPHIDFADLMDRDSQSVSMNKSLKYLLYCESNRIYRFRFLQALASLGLRLYGNALWKTEIKGSALEPCFAGKIDSYSDYFDLIRSVKINLNLRSLQGFDAPTHRDFLVPRMGGFLLSSATRLTKIDWDEYDPHQRFQLDQFPWSSEKANPQQMAEAARDYLENENARQDWIDAASKEITAYHTYAKRIEQLGEILDSETIPRDENEKEA